MNHHSAGPSRRVQIAKRNETLIDGTESQPTELSHNLFGAASEDAPPESSQIDAEALAWIREMEYFDRF